MITAGEAELVRAFEACDPGLGGLSHADHLRVAWVYLQREPFGLAGQRFSTGLRRFALSRGAPMLFHETITWAYLALLAERRHVLGPESTFDDVRNGWPELFDHRSGALRALYRAEDLDSALAREVFLLPGRSASARERSREAAGDPADENAAG